MGTRTRKPLTLHLYTISAPARREPSLRCAMTLSNPKSLLCRAFYNISAPPVGVPYRDVTINHEPLIWRPQWAAEIESAFRVGREHGGSHIKSPKRHRTRNAMGSFFIVFWLRNIGAIPLSYIKGLSDPKSLMPCFLNISAPEYFGISLLARPGGWAFTLKNCRRDII